MAVAPHPPQLHVAVCVVQRLPKIGFAGHLVALVRHKRAAGQMPPLHVIWCVVGGVFAVDADPPIPGGFRQVVGHVHAVKIRQVDGVKVRIPRRAHPLARLRVDVAGHLYGYAQMGRPDFRLDLRGCHQGLLVTHLPHRVRDARHGLAVNGVSLLAQYDVTSAAG